MEGFWVCSNVTKKGNRTVSTSKDLNGDKITFKKLETVDPSLDTFMDNFYQEHDDLMKKLEDK